MGWSREITDIAQKLSFVLKRLPMAIVLVDASGNIVGKSGQLSGLLGCVIPSRDPQTAGRWRFTDRSGATIAPADWPGARALRGEHAPGLVGRYQDEGEQLIKVTSVPATRLGSEIAAVSFLQRIDRASCSADGCHSDLEYLVVEALKRSVSDP